MSSVINTNINSLIAQNNLNKSQSSLQSSLTRLSSGLRINSAADDAAGLAIASRFSTQINGLHQASRNANDGISLSQTTEGALDEVTNNLQRVRELAVQAANSTNSASDRAALDAEVQQRLSEIDRTATQTSFNGLNVLDGTFGTATFQVGANVGQTITVGINTSVRTSAIGKTADYVNSTTQFSAASAVGAQGTGVDTSAIAGGGDVTIAIGTGSAISVGASVAGNTALGQSAASAYAKAQAINASGIGGLTATADTTTTFAFSNVTTTNTAYSLSLNGTAIYSALNTSATGTNTALTGTAVATAINANASATGVTASFDATTGRLSLSNAGGGDIAISQTTTGETGTGLGALGGSNNAVNTTTGSIATATSGTAVTKTYGGSIRLTAGQNITVGGTTPARIGYTAGSLALGNSALNSASVTTVANANTTITKVDAALDTVNSFRGTLGAIQNRFSSAIASIQSTTQNLTASRSRIQDADFAAETASLSRSNILQQAGISVLSQANAAPQQILSLLK